jgi:hypothetical protein
MVLGTAAQKYMMGLSEQQEVLLNCADIIMDAYQMETAILRAKKSAAANGEEAAGHQIDMAAVYCNDAIQRVDAHAKNTIAAIAEGDEGRTLLVALKRFTKNNSPINTIAARQRIADALIGDGADDAKKMQSIEEYAVESSINKVACSEALDYVVDEMVQIYGGYGYSADYPAEKAYRDSRINRIFEGTNEINRMLIPGQLMKRAMKGKLGLLQAAKALQDEILNPQMSFDEDSGLLAAETKLAQNAKKIALMVLGTAAQKYMMALSEEQEVLLNCADIIMDAYQMETAILRAKKYAGSNGEEAAARYIDMAGVYCNDAIQRVDAKAKNTIAAIAEGDEGRTLLVALKRYTKNNSPINTIAARQRIADNLIAANGYSF